MSSRIASPTKCQSRTAVHRRVCLKSLYNAPQTAWLLGWPRSPAKTRVVAVLAARLACEIAGPPPRATEPARPRGARRMKLPRGRAAHAAAGGPAHHQRHSYSGMGQRADAPRVGGIPRSTSHTREATLPAALRIVGDDAAVVAPRSTPQPHYRFARGPFGAGGPNGQARKGPGRTTWVPPRGES